MSVLPFRFGHEDTWLQSGDLICYNRSSNCIFFVRDGRSLRLTQGNADKIMLETSNLDDAAVRSILSAIAATHGMRLHAQDPTAVANLVFELFH